MAALPDLEGIGLARLKQWHAQVRPESRRIGANTHRY
jgi:hypothetical protein